MKEYPKINTIYKRNENGELLEGTLSMPEIEFLSNNQWLFTEKIDGTNIRVMWDGDTVRFGGKTDKAQIPTFLLAKLQNIFVAEKLKYAFNPMDAINVCLYGEGYGAKIQKGGGNYIPDGCDFILFDVWINGWWLKWVDVVDIANKLEIKHVPVLGYGTIQNAINLTRAGFNSAFGHFLAEGIVLRPMVDLFARNGDRVITKIKHRDFNRWITH
jgi:hypothetical protein